MIKINEASTRSISNKEDKEERQSTMEKRRDNANKGETETIKQNYKNEQGLNK